MRGWCLCFPIPAENQPGLIADLQGDPFVWHALSSTTCELYHRYGMFLAPPTAALAIIKHCQFGHRRPAVINDGNEADGGETADISGEAARRNSFARGAAHSPAERVTEKKAKGLKYGGRACRRCRPAKTTARTASGGKEIIMSTSQRS